MSTEPLTIIVCVELGLLVLVLFVGIWIYRDMIARFSILSRSEVDAKMRARNLEAFLIKAGIAIKIEKPDPVHEDVFTDILGNGYLIPDPTEKKTDDAT